MNTSLAPRALAPHILRTMATAQREGRRVDLESLRDELGVRRNDVRRALSVMHGQGLVDATRWRLTFAGFALGTAVGAGNVTAVDTGRVVRRAFAA